MTPKEHAKMLGLFMWIFAGFQLAIVALLGIFWTAIVGFIMTAISHAPQRPNEPPPPPPELIFGFFIFIMIIIVVATLAFSIPKVVAGYGLRKGRSWAKIWTIVACVLGIMSFPIGTAVGVYGLWFILGDQGKAYFDSPEFATPQSAPPPNNWA